MCIYAKFLLGVKVQKEFFSIDEFVFSYYCAIQNVSLYSLAARK